MPLRYLETNKDELKRWGIVDPVDDARLYTSLYGDMCGVVAGCECTLVGANTIHVSSGWGIVQGRRVEIQAEDVTVQLGTSATASNFRLLVRVEANLNTIRWETNSGAAWPLGYTVDAVTEGTGWASLPIALYTATNATVVSVTTSGCNIYSPITLFYQTTAAVPSATASWTEITEANQENYGLSGDHGYKYAYVIQDGGFRSISGLLRFDSEHMHIVHYRFQSTLNARTNAILETSAATLASARWQRAPLVSEHGIVILTDRLPISDVTMIIGVHYFK